MLSLRSVIVGGFALCGVATPLMAASAPKATPVDAEFKMMDTNKDGRVSVDEHAAGAKKMFSSMDANKDGKVTAGEMDAAQARRSGKNAGKSGMSAAEKIKVVDSDNDGVLTAQEHLDASRGMFTKMDTNKDGFLTKEELAAGHARIMK